MKIAVLSDTHGCLRSEVREIIDGCDAVIHGGDINSQSVLDEIRRTAGESKPVFVVRGNNDKEWAKQLPVTLEFKLDGKSFFLVHNKRDIPADIKADIVIFGHTHKYYEEDVDGSLWLNPGSCGKRRFSMPVTMAMLDISDAGTMVTRIDIENGVPAVSIPDGDRMSVIGRIIKLMDKGMDTGAIAAKLKTDKAFVDQVAMIKVTHPGVDAEGILNKMEANRR
ncbi:MAG: metallophosphoesterase family protein [Clostridia bacterium]|nr:metallophosphoesterase family protein [Clostridia bacterium]